ncbi:MULTISPECIES: FxSxx-COOH system tetratricopeptide repeat protein [unclassified Streptomyces]|uniref:FxSxx-COOH system tetratricopeptide repeat protein n=1 Tax=unclassified Streptomyces TaxID=2593676 RepID=UPI003D765AA9
MSGTRRPVGAVERGAARQTVTISFAGFNRAWAAWIGDRLERRGLRVVYLRWDAPPEVSLTDLLRDLALADGRIVMLVSDWYFRLGPRTFEEWNAALREVVAPDASRFAAVSVTTAPVPTAVAALAPVDLVNIGPEEAERRLVERLDLPYEPLSEAGDGRHEPRFPSAMPEVWGNVPRRNTRFTGREPLLNDAYHLLHGSEPGAGVLALYGMSGVGKTQLAAEYVYRFSSEYDVVWWINAEKRVSYRRLLAELAPKLGLSTGAEYGERLRAVRDALRRGEPYSRWLLILDGADDPDQIWDLVPTGPGHVLITSRNPRWGEHNSRLMQVPVYARDESVAFIRRRAPRLTEAEADQLAEALEDLPLLLDQTAGWLNDSDLSVEDYIALLEGGIDQDVVKVSADFPLAFQTAWSILLNKLRETVPESVDLLRLCTFFAPGFVPVRLLKDMPHDELPEQLAGLLQDPLLWNRAINQLRQYSVVRLESHETSGEPGSSSSGESLYLHRMVHQIVRNDMPEADRQEFVDVVRRALAAADPGRATDTRLWDSYAEIVPHLKYADVLQSQDGRVQRLVLNCLRYMYFAGEYSSGVKLGERALRAWRTALGEHHPRIWELTYHYANLLRSSGDYESTEALERQAADHLRQERGERDLDYLRAVNGLGADLWGLGRYDEALELYQWLYPTYRDLLGEEDSRTLNALNNLGFAHRLLGRYQEALDIDKTTLELRRRVLKARHPWALLSEVSYAIGLRLLGRYTEAESMQTKNVRECRLVLGTDNPQTLRAEHNLALCRLRGGDRPGAGALLTRVLERYERKLGDRHAETLAAAVSQSCFAREFGDIDQAREASESVMARYETLLTPGHPFIAGARANHALILRSVGERDQAHALAEEALADMTAAVGESHPYTLGVAVNASALRNLAGDTEGAAALSRDTVPRAVESLGRTHPLTLSARVAHAADLRGLHDRPQAEKVEQEALADLEATLGKQHVHTISARSRNRPYWDFEPQAT